MARDIGEWLDGLGLGRYANVFADNEIDLHALPHITEEDLKEIGVALGSRRKLLAAIAELVDLDQPPTAIERSDERYAGAEAERRQLTVMFCDLVGSTALAERLDPEHTREVIRAYQDAATGAINRFDGHVAKYMGDGILAYFGYPQAHENDAESAVRAGLEVVEATARLRPHKDVQPEVRIGVSTGLVVVGDFVGDGAAQEVPVIGETPNRAARLQGLAQPGQVLVDENVQRLAGGHFDYEDLGRHELKGFSEPIAACRVVGERKAESRFEAAHGTELTKLVGRDQELGLLLERWRQAKIGEGQAVMLSGEPGIGKSRILRALTENVTGGAVATLAYQCAPSYTNTALFPVIDQIERAAKFALNDSSEVKIDKLEALLTSSGNAAPEIVALFAAMLSIPTHDRLPALDLTPEQVKAQTLDALVKRLLALAADRPVLFLFEDAHWIDPSTQELLMLTLNRLRDASILMVITFRPEYEPPWRGLANITALTLNRLSRSQCAQLVGNMTHHKSIPAEVMAQIVEKTDGVPLFVEELTKTVVESGLLHDEGDAYALDGALPPRAIPASLQDSLMARLDRLPPQVKEVAQMAAALGRSFSYEVLEAVSPPSSDDLRAALNKLTEAELIYQRGLPREASYEFKHALVQDTAYESLLLSTRQQLHARIAETLETQFSETAEGEPELLAHHYTEAGLAAQAVPYWHRAGQRAAERSAYPEAVAHLSKGLELLAELPESMERDKSELELQIALGPALMSSKGLGLPEVEAVYTRAKELAETSSDSDRLFTALFGLWLTNQARGDVAIAKDMAAALIGSYEHSEESGQRLQAHHTNWTSNLFSGNFSLANYHSSRGMEIYDREEHADHKIHYGAHDPAACGLTFIGVSDWFLGKVDRGIESVATAVALGEELGHPVSYAVALLFCSVYYQFRRNAAEAAKYAEIGINLCAEHNIAAWRPPMLTLHGWALSELGGGNAVTAIEAGMKAWKATGNRQFWPLFLALQAQAEGKSGNPQGGLEKAATGLAHAETTGEFWLNAELHRQTGELLLARSARNKAKAEVAFTTAIETARGQEARSMELRAAASLARLWGESKKRQEAYALLAPVYAQFTEGLDTPDLKEAKKLLAELS